MPTKILLVDDREDNLISMESILEPSGYDFVKANSGRDALKILLKDFDFALILMDVKMPNLNGFETASLIYEREKLKHIPMIFITANNYGEENIFKGYRTGAVDYIYKPINPELLRAKVSVFVDLYKKNHQLITQEQKLIAINKSLENEIKERIASENKVNEINKPLIQNIDAGICQ
jgi:response regulator RpfG family c-di-GMP phosphodiesterase